MTFNTIIKKKNISAYRLSKDSGVPYMTINDLFNKKTTICKCNAKTVYKIAKALNTSVEELIEPYTRNRTSFEIFKSNICHRLKELGDVNFIEDLLSSNEIDDYYDLNWYPECLYLLAMLDYISRINNIEICPEYNKFRKMKLSSIIYPSSVLMLDMAENTNRHKKTALKNAIDEFKRFNIVENDVRNVV